MDEQEEILDQSIKPGTLLGRIPGETDWFDVKQKGREFKNKYIEKQQKIKLRDKEYRIIYQKRRRITDINFRIRCNLASRIRTAIKNGIKSAHTLELLGCSIEHCRIHLEKQFKEGMSWANMGKWHIDHIKPCCSFDLTKPEEQRACFHYSNLQPLWAEENIRKGGKVV